MRCRTMAAWAMMAMTAAAWSAEGPDVQRGIASFYSWEFKGQETASGRTFDPDEMVAAHPSYPLGTRLRVTNLRNHRSVDVRVVDRGPSRDNRREGVVIDLSRKAAQALGFTRKGRAPVRIEVISRRAEEGSGPAR